MKTEDIKKMLKPKEKKTLRYLNTGSTLLNLAVSGKINGGLPIGTYVLFVGDTNAGKSFLSKAFLAEASINKSLDNYELILDDVERSDFINTEKFFGPKLAKRIQPPRTDSEGRPQPSETVEDLYKNVDAALKRGPFVYICDSETSLTCRADVKKAEKDDGKGSYNLDKPKIHSTNLKRLLGPLERTGSVLVIINQTRDRIGFGSQFDPKTRPGGRALEFYSTVQLWTSIKERIKKRAAGKKRQVGILCRIRVKRTRVTGRDRTVDIPIYTSSGIDDVGSCINWLIEEGHWKGTKEIDGKVDAPEFQYNGSKEELVKKIEDEGLEKELRAIVAEMWQEIEDACIVARKNRYA